MLRWIGRSIAIATLAALVAAIIANLLVGSAHAQDVGAILGAAALPPPSVPAPPAAYTFFSDSYNAVDGAIQDAAVPIVSGAAAQTRAWVAAGLTLYLAIFCGIQMFPAGSGGSMFLSGLFRELLAGAIVISALQIYADQIMPFLLQTLPGELAALFTFGGSPKSGATVAGNFDHIWNATTDLANLVGDRIPDEISLSALKLMAELAVLKMVGYAFLVWGFAVFLAVSATQTVLGILGILFVGAAAFPQGRKYAWGWFSSMLATICTTTVLALVLGLMLGVVRKQYDFLSALPPATVYAAQADGFAKIVGALLVLAIMMSLAPFIGLAIFGGVHNSVNAVGAAAGAAGGAVMAGGRRLAGAIR